MISQHKYFDMWDDMRIKGRWHLRAPLDEHGKPMNGWQFKEGRCLESNGKPFFRLTTRGFPLDFTLSGRAIPLVSEQVVEIFKKLGIQDEVQFIPASVEEHGDTYFILNTLRIIKCIDDARCEEVEYWTPEDGVPDRVGEYQKITGLKVDPTRVGTANIFRPQGWVDALIVSGRLKAALEEEDMTGPLFIEV